MEEFCPKDYWALIDAILTLLRAQLMLCQETGGAREEQQKGSAGWRLGRKVTPSMEIFGYALRFLFKLMPNI